MTTFLSLDGRVAMQGPGDSWAVYRGAEFPCGAPNEVIGLWWQNNQPPIMWTTAFRTGVHIMGAFNALDPKSVMFEPLLRAAWNAAEAACPLSSEGGA